MAGDRFMTCTFTKYGHYISEKFLEDVYPIIDLLLTNLLPELIITVCVLVMYFMRRLVHSRQPFYNSKATPPSVTTLDTLHHHQ